MSDKHLEAVAAILAADNGDNLEEIWIEAQQAVEDEGDAAQYDPSVLLYEMYLATAKELIEAWVGDRELYEINYKLVKDSDMDVDCDGLPYPYAQDVRSGVLVRVSVEGNDHE